RATMLLNLTHRLTLNHYRVWVIPNPPNVDVSDPRGQLDVLQKRLHKSKSAKLQKREEIHLDEFVGLELKSSSADSEITIRTILYFTSKVTYIIAAGIFKEKEQKQAAQIDKVFDSFRILPQ
ncbi:MAG: hypothetical protein KY445_15525, partial [Armatimonadetes bacterium]|nr:hypothetical protein [Armatimonadota bacterium]